MQKAWSAMVGWLWDRPLLQACLDQLAKGQKVRKQYFDFARLSFDSETLVVKLNPDFGAHCDLECSFCFEKSTPFLSSFRPTPDPKLIRESLDRILRSNPQPNIVIRSEDILQYPEILGLVELCEAHGRHAILRTPGHRLADRAFCRRFSGHDVTFELTFFSHDADTTHRMSGRPTLHQELCQALVNLAQLGLPHRVDIVVTRDNVYQLAQTLSFLEGELGIRRTSLCLFRTPSLGLLRWLRFRAVTARRGIHQHARFDVLNAQLGRLQTMFSVAQGVELNLIGYPACQLTEELAGQCVVSLELAPSLFNDAQSPRAACARCSLVGQCSSIDAQTPSHYPLRSVDPVAAVRLANAVKRGHDRHGGLRALAEKLQKQAQEGDLIAVEEPADGSVRVGRFGSGQITLSGAHGANAETVSIENFVHHGSRVLLIRPEGAHTTGPQSAASMDAAARLGVLIHERTLGRMSGDMQ